MVSITGGIITKEKGSSITYQFKCDSCSFVEPIETSLTLTKGVTEISVKKCPNCGKSQITKIRYVNDHQTVSTL